MTTLSGPKNATRKGCARCGFGYYRDHSAAPGLGEIQEAAAGLGGVTRTVNPRRQEVPAWNRVRRLKRENVHYELGFPPHPSENEQGYRGVHARQRARLGGGWGGLTS